MAARRRGSFLWGGSSTDRAVDFYWRYIEEEDWTLWLIAAILGVMGTAWVGVK